MKSLVATLRQNSAVQVELGLFLKGGAEPGAKVTDVMHWTRCTTQLASVILGARLVWGLVCPCVLSTVRWNLAQSGFAKQGKMLLENLLLTLCLLAGAEPAECQPLSIWIRSCCPSRYRGWRSLAAGWEQGASVVCSVVCSRDRECLSRRGFTNRGAH